MIATMRRPLSKRLCLSAAGAMLALILTLSLVLTRGEFDNDQAKLPPNFQLAVFSSGRGRARGLHRLPGGDVLLIKAGSMDGADDSAIILLWDDNNDGVADGNFELVSSGHGLTHGIEYILPENNRHGEGGLLLASSDTTVFSWSYQPGDRTSNLGQGRPIVANMNAQSNSDDLGAYKGHWTRTLALSPADQRYLYISVGSRGNVDKTSFRARIRRFDLSSEEYPSSIDFRDGEVFADGLRNEVGLAFDASGTLWGVENGADRLYRSDLGGDIHNDNPAEELNRFDGPVGTHYGYPWCWTEYNLPGYGLGRGTIWAWPSADTERDDEWCRANTRAPALAFQGHSAPLGIAFFNQSDYSSESCAGRGTFPADADGNAFVGFHGSWNRDIPTGYKVVQVPFDTPGGSPLGTVDDLLAHAGFGAKWPSGVRPVDVAFDQCGRLLVSDDGTGSIFTISYNGVDTEQMGLSPTSGDGANNELNSTDISSIPSASPTTSSLVPPIDSSDGYWLAPQIHFILAMVLAGYLIVAG